LDASFTFFRRQTDRSIDEMNLADKAAELSHLLLMIAQRHGQPALLIGFSSGAIMAAALIAGHTTLISGAVLLRPEKPFAQNCFPDLGGTPVLLVSGKDDERRERSDAVGLADQLRAAGAAVEWDELACGHGFDPESGDVKLTRAWLAKRGL
jgi:phospholipase/carboxylesterase